MLELYSELVKIAEKYAAVDRMGNLHWERDDVIQAMLAAMQHSIKEMGRIHADSMQRLINARS
jgi:hypothetical protein